jgi:lysophospholipase L1-like esterase
MRMALVAILVGAAVIAAVAAALIVRDDGDRRGDGAESDVYLSIGDSIAAGTGASDAGRTSFAALLAARRGLRLVDLAGAGATTGQVIEEQLPDATSALAGGDVRLVTVSAGGNDLAALIPNAACTEDPLPAACPLDESLASVEANLRAIVLAMRAADADVPIVLLAYPNFFSGSGHAFDAPAGRVLPRLAEVIRRVAASAERVYVAEPAADFERRGGELTHILDARPDPHPNDAGHRVIADAFEEGLDAE